MVLEMKIALEDELRSFFEKKIKIVNLEVLEISYKEIKVGIVSEDFRGMDYLERDSLVRNILEKECPELTGVYEMTYLLLTPDAAKFSLYD